MKCVVVTNVPLSANRLDSYVSPMCDGWTPWLVCRVRCIFSSVREYLDTCIKSRLLSNPEEHNICVPHMETKAPWIHQKTKMLLSLLELYSLLIYSLVSKTKTAFFICFEKCNLLFLPLELLTRALNHRFKKGYQLTFYNCFMGTGIFTVSILFTYNNCCSNVVTCYHLMLCKCAANIPSFISETIIDLLYK